ncbi:UDP-N-acetylmuramoyl-L-alanyl-D-glutamate--2,6-diaminopimelate ligase [Aeromicrobium sp.]|nr:UDP-N-acetylmuramoyl-L-alanyl-D-glutamate--2,6-diaminopimelate ligase [Candidatus Saccharibacteria bacterium]
MSAKSVVKKFIPMGLFYRVEPTGHLLESMIVTALNGFPGKGMKVIGVTGTNGKTTTAFMIHRMLQNAGYNTALMTTVAWGIGDDIEYQQEHYTNVPIRQLMTRLKKLKAAKIDYLVMEITSQALAQNRAWGVPFTMAVMTNVTHEHLDYHKTFERYRDAKRKLFKLANKNSDGMQVGIINIEDPSAQLFASDITNPIMYGNETGDLQATNVKLTSEGSTYTAKAGDDEYTIVCNLPGSFNVSNSLAAVAVGGAIGLTREEVEKGIAALKGVGGRMTTIDEGQNYSVIVDYAHTPDSFEKVFKDLRPVIKGKLICMFGSAGRRDESKRAVQGELAGKYCDEVVITEEDDRDADGQEIMEQIASGAEKSGKIRKQNLFLIHDRTEAITFALKRARTAGDTVILLGKGPERTILRNGPKAAELRHLKQDDNNPDRVITDDWDEIATAHAAVKLAYTARK